jgi:hypothetical protein
VKAEEAEVEVYEEEVEVYEEKVEIYEEVKCSAHRVLTWQAQTRQTGVCGEA